VSLNIDKNNIYFVREDFMVDLSKKHNLEIVAISGEEKGSYFGSLIRGLGDLNGDGIDDFGVLSPNANKLQGSKFGSGRLDIYFGYNNTAYKNEFLLPSLSINLQHQLNARSEILEGRIEGSKMVLENLDHFKEHYIFKDLVKSMKNLENSGHPMTAEELENLATYSDRLQDAYCLYNG
jgi:hypothetical protein